MKTFIFKIAFFLALTAATPQLASAAMSPLSLAVVPGIQFPSEEYTVTGARLSLLWGRHHGVYGLDFGVLGNVTDQKFNGIALSGLFNLTNGDTTIIALQFAGLTNVNTSKTHVFGLQLAAIANINRAESEVAGLQLALVNLSSFTKVYGFQIGLYNTALDVYGLQIGVVNVAKNLHGVQIGVCNINETGLFYVAPILNIGF